MTLGEARAFDMWCLQAPIDKACDSSIVARSARHRRPRRRRCRRVDDRRCAAVVAGGVGARRQGVRTQGDDSLKQESPHLGEGSGRGAREAQLGRWAAAAAALLRRRARRSWALFLYQGGYPKLDKYFAVYPPTPPENSILINKLAVAS
jgi:hypothetical protein